MVLSKRHLSFLVLGILVVSFAINFVPLTIGSLVTVNTETQTWVKRNWEGAGSPSFDGELLDGTQYITSWMHNGDSEKIVAEGQIKYLFPAGDLLRKCRYYTYATTTGVWKPINEVVPGEIPEQEVGCGPNTLPGQWASLDVSERVLNGPTVGGIAVELQLYLGIINPVWETVARDEAYLRPGIGDIAFDKPLYEIGETAIIRYHVGYASSQREGGGWSIQLYEPPDRGGSVVDSWTVSDNTLGQVTYTFVLTDFVAGESNIFTIKLLNTITGVKDDDAAVVDDAELAPNIVSVSVEPPGTRSVGDDMAVTVVAVPNDLTGLPISEYYFHIRAGPSTIIVDAWQPTSTFFFTIQSDGDLQVNVCVRDAERSNCAKRVNVLVEEPDTPFGWDDADPYTAPWWLWFSVGLLLAGALGVQFLPQIPQGGRTIVSIFFLAGSAVLLLSYLVIPALDAWIRDIVPGVF